MIAQIYIRLHESMQVCTNLCQIARIYASMRKSKFVQICAILREDVLAKTLDIVVVLVVVVILVVVLHLVAILLIVIIRSPIPFNVLDILSKPPGFYLNPDLRYPCLHCHPYCCHCPWCCPPHCIHPPCHHHHDTDALNILYVLAKIPGLYLIPELRYSCYRCCPCCCHHTYCCPPPRPHPPCHHHHEADTLDILAKTTVLSLVTELRYPCRRCCPCYCYCPCRCLKF